MVVYYLVVVGAGAGSCVGRGSGGGVCVSPKTDIIYH